MKKLILVILLLISNIFAEKTVSEQCHLEGFFVVCGEKKTEIKVPNYCEWMKRDDAPNEGLGVFLRYPSDAQGPGDEEYFILDYKNMMVYDKGCLGGNYATVEDNNIVYDDNKSKDLVQFKKQDFEHCKQPLDKWLKKPYKPYP